MLAVAQQFGGLARVQSRVLAGEELNLDTQHFEQALQLPFYIKEVGSSATVYPVFRYLVANHDTSQHRLLIDGIAILLKAQASLEQANARLLTILVRSEEHTSELQSRPHLVCRL